MISKVNGFKQNNLMFKSNSQMTWKEFREINAQKYKFEHEKQNDNSDKVRAISGLADSTAWFGAKIAGAKNPDEAALRVYLATMLAMASADAYQHRDDKEEKEEKFDLKDKEKTKQYNQLLQKNEQDCKKYMLKPIPVVAAAAAGITTAVCYIKKLPNKLDKIATAALVSIFSTMIIGMAAVIIKENNEDKHKEQNNKLSTNV